MAKRLDGAFLPIPTAIAEAFNGIRISGEEWQCLWLILRKTYGWRKTADAIPLSQFVEATKVDKAHIIRAIKNLESKKVIIIANIGNDKAKTYSLNNNHEEWVGLPKKATRIANIGNNKEKANGINGNSNKRTGLPILATLPKKATAIANIGNDDCQYWKQTLPILAPSIDNKDTLTKDTNKRYFYVASAESLRLGNLLFSEIIKQNSKSRLANLNTAAKEKTITGWALDIEKLIGIDKQEPSTVEEVIFFATHDDFWGANILSGKKLREKWDTLTRRMNGNTVANGNQKFAGIAAWVNEKEKEAQEAMNVDGQ